MLLPINWLKDYVDIKVDSKTLSDKLTMSGSHVESIISLKDNIKNIVVGKIESIQAHKNADKLIICKVNIGEEILDIVTAARNVNEGDYIPLALVGAKLADGTIIEKTDFRGVDSFGMLCSLSELGYSDNVIPKEMRDGIYILDREHPLGEDIVKAMELEEDIIEFEITPNRPDCLSIIGMAREAAATLDLDLKEPNIKIENELEDISKYIKSIEIETPNCNRYYGRTIKDVKIGPSPQWMQNKLMEAGMRPISNIVDVTNYVMLEYGQPLHAFDADKLEGQKIIVRQAKDGETIKTLDDVDRKLSSDDIVIADEKYSIGIAGVMGGFETEVSPATKNVLLEGANFDDKSIRLTSKKFNLRSEASSRFEKGIDPKLSQIAVDRACQLIEEIGAGRVVKGNIDVYENVKIENIIRLRPERANKILGIEISKDEMIKYLDNLGIKSEIKDEFIYSIVPSFRLDLELEVDLIEEIGRMYGFHNIKSKPLVGVLTRGEKPYEKQIEDKAKRILQGLGLNEVMTYSFISPRAYDRIKISEDNKLRNYIKLINPLGEDYSVMRTTLIPNMLDLLSRNYNRGVKQCLFYEIGNIFTPKELPVKRLPDEDKVISFGVYGEKDFYYLKEVIDKTLNKLGIIDLEYIKDKELDTFHPGRTARIMLKGEELGVLGEIHPDVSENYEIKDKVYIGWLDFEKIIEETSLDIKFKSLPKYPSMNRDIALILDREIPVGDIEKLIKKHGEELIEKIELFDVYTGDQIPEDMKSVAYSITYRSADRTLIDEEVNTIQKSIVDDLKEAYGAELRS